MPDREAQTDLQVQQDLPVQQESQAPKESHPQKASQPWQESQESAETSGEEEQEWLYYYNALGDADKAVYREVYDAIILREEAVLSTLDETVVDKVFQCVMNDHPEIFYCTAYRIEKQLHDESVVRVTFRPEYYMTPEEVEQNRARIRAYVNKCLEGLPDGADEYAKVKYVYEYIIRNTEYVPGSDNNQDICSVFVGGKSVCQGYAKATQYILSQLGIEVALAFGKVENDFHSWNLVRVDGDYYYMDTTWGDAGYVRPGGGVSMDAPQEVNYEYFLITTGQLLTSRVIDNVVPLPECVATQNNYYVREGLYLRSYDEIWLGQLFDAAKSSGQNYVTFMCAGSQVYEEVKDHLITQQEIFGHLSSSEAVTYSYNDDLYTLIFWIE